MTKHIALTEPKWNTLKEEIKKDYPASVLLLRSKMRSVLGFVDRSYVEYTPKYKNTICLDFYDEPKRLMFLLKYGELL